MIRQTPVHLTLKVYFFYLFFAFFHDNQGYAILGERLDHLITKSNLLWGNFRSILFIIHNYHL